MIPVFEPIIGEEEIDSVVSALRRGEISGSYGTAISEFEYKFAEFCDCKYGVSVTSGTTALHLAVAASGIRPGDEVLISSSTNIATALAVAHNGAIPVPIDSEELTWNLDLNLIEQAITNRTRAIIPVHLFGHPVDMDELCKISEKHNLTIIEDCAESHGAMCRGRKTGSFGSMSCFSFYANKIITTGEGGMVVTNNSELYDKLKLLRNLGFTTPRFRHEVLGFNFRMTGYQAAMGLAQLKKIEHIISQKRRVAKTYNKYLKNIDGLILPHEAEWAFNVYWMYAIRITSKFGMNRDTLASKLREKGIDTRTFFYPMNKQPCLIQLEGFSKKNCTISESLWEEGLYLPSTNDLDENTINMIAETIRQIKS